MTLPRPVLIALLGLALCAAAFLATRSANDTGSAVSTTAPTTQPVTPAGPAAKHAAKPETKPAVPVTKPQAPPKAAVSPEIAKTLPAVRALAHGDVVVFFFS